VFGALMILLLQYAPDGIWPFVRKIIPSAPAARAPASAARLAIRPKPAAGETILDVSLARKQFGGLVAVNDVSFSVKSGEIVGLIGPNGAGKSTTFNLVTGVLALTSGTVTYRGAAIGGARARDIVKRGIGRTFQHVQLLPSMTVLENVALGGHLRGDFDPQGGFLASILRLNKDEEAKLLHEAAIQIERVGLEDVMYAEAGSLALGQQRIVEIARALCCDPALLLLDEPAAGLNPEESMRLGAMIRRLRDERDITVLLVEHDMPLVMGACDHIAVLDHGEKLCDGSPSAVRNDARVVEAYLGAEAIDA
jgi:branched-chain amino acid transport system permease protein